MKRFILGVAVVLCTVTASACGGEEGRACPGKVCPGFEQTTTVEAGGTTEAVTVELRVTNGSGQSGTATLTDRGRSGTGVLLSVTPSEHSEGDAQPAALHAAPCAEILKAKDVQSLEATVAKELTEVRDGTSETTTARTIAELTGGGYSIAVHEPRPPFEAVLCGEIPGR